MKNGVIRCSTTVSLGIHNNLGVVYRETGSIDKAIAEFLQALRYKPDWVKPYFNLGRQYLRKGDKMRAHRTFESVLKLDPSHREAKRLYDLTIGSDRD